MFGQQLNWSNLVSLLPRSSTLLEHSLGRGRCSHRRHAASVVAHNAALLEFTLFFLLFFENSKLNSGN